MVTPIKLFGVLVTYRRADALSTTLDRLRAQTRPIDLLLVIDNAGSSEAKRIVEAHIANGLVARYVDAGDNLGPAGGFALGMKIILEEATDTDWIFLFDDDDPPFFDKAISDAASFGIEMTLADPATAGVGISGGRFDARRGRGAQDRRRGDPRSGARGSHHGRRSPRLPGGPGPNGWRLPL